MSNHIIIALGQGGIAMERCLRSVLSREVTQSERTVNGDTRSCYYLPGSDTPLSLHLRYLEICLGEQAAKLAPARGLCGRELPLEPRYTLSIPSTLKDDGKHPVERPAAAAAFCAAAGDVDAKLRELQVELSNKSHRSEVDIHLCASLSDALGCGAITDAVCRIRQMFPHRADSESQVRLQLYLSLPGTPQAGQLHAANAYAALAELSSLNTRQWTPLDKNPALEQPLPYVFEVSRPENDILQPVFSNAILLDGEAEAAETFAHVFYERFFIWPQAEEDAKGSVMVCERALLNENLLKYQFGYSPEMSREVPRAPYEDAYLPASQPWAIHSNRFSTLSYRRLRKPIAELNTHYAAVIARETLLRLRYNQPSASGYMNPESGLDTPEQKEEYRLRLHFRQQSRLQHILAHPEEWGLVEESAITRQMPSGSQDPSLPIHTRWKDIAAKAAKDISASEPDWKRRGALLKAAMEQAFEKAYYCPEEGEPQGAAEFYRVDEKLVNRVQAHVNQLRNNVILKPLLSPEEGERRGLEDIHLTTRALHEALHTEKGIIARFRAEHKLLHKQLKKLQKEADEQLERFSPSLPLRLVAWTQQELTLTIYADALAKLFTLRTRLLAHSYAEQYLKLLAAEVVKLPLASAALIQHVDTLLWGDSGSLGIEGMIKSTFPPVVNTTALQHQVCLDIANPESIRELDNKLCSDGEPAQKHRSYLNSRLCQRLLKALQLEEVSTEELVERFRSAVDQQLMLNAATELLHGDPLFSFTQASDFYRDVRDLFVSMDKLGDQLKESSRCSLELNQSELIARHESNAPIPQHLRNTNILNLPDDSGDWLSLQERLKAHIGLETIPNISPDSVSLLRLENGLPPRAFTRVREYYDAYKQADRAGAPSPFTQEHAPFPQFFPTEEEIVAMYRGERAVDARYGCLFQRYLLGWVFPRTNPVTDAHYWCTPLADGGDGRLTLEEMAQKRPSRRLTKQAHEHFLWEDYFQAAHCSVEQAFRHEDEFNLFELPKLFSEMRETQRLWNAVLKPAFVDERVMAKRREVIERLQAAREMLPALQDSPEQELATHLLARFARELGME